jgi:hypothetical protein
MVQLPSHSQKAKASRLFNEAQEEVPDPESDRQKIIKDQ